jgi:hypothetical protein
MMPMDDAPAGEDDSILTAVTNATSISAPKGRKQSKAAAKGTRQASRTKKAQPADVSVIELSSTLQTDEAPAPPEQPKRITRRIASRAEPPPPADSTTFESQPAKQTKAKGKGKAQPRLSEDESQLHSELQAAIEASIASSSTPKAEDKLSRGTKRTSDGKPKVDSSVVVLEDPPATFVEEKPKAKRGRKPKQGQTELQRSSDAAEVSSGLTEPPKAAPKSRKGKKAAKQAQREPEENPQRQDDVHMEDADSQQEEKLNPARQGTPDPTTEEPGPGPPSPTPAKALRSSAHQLKSTPAKPSAPPAGQKALTPSGSPQSSDAENKPPSSRPPPSARQRIRVPLAAGTPNTSPSKRQALGKITSTVPWEPADLENIFFASPVKANYASSGADSDKENVNYADVDLDKLGEDKKALRDMVAKVKKGMGNE